MRAVWQRSHGGPEVLSLEEVPAPTPGPEEVLVDVIATALNRGDIVQRVGVYPGSPMPFEILGLEYSGRVAAVGERCALVNVGDEVMGIVAGGAYAEQLVVHERQTLPVPATVPLADAAAIPEVFMTAWDALVVQGGLTSGRWVLVHAGASGVGTAAIQIAGAIGARVAVTCSAGKADACRSLGADLVLERSPHDWLNDLLVAVPAGVDVVLDVIGGEEANRHLRAAAVGGTVVQVGLMGGGQVQLDLGLVVLNRLRIVGTVLRRRPLEEKIMVTRRFAAEVLPLFDSGELKPVIDSRYPLEAIADAHRALELSTNVGKIVIDVGYRPGRY
jgi:putative PIG3 family NAD(P)H quinone oxidoreductase